MGAAMTGQEIATLVIQRWRLEHSAEAIMVALVMLGTPATKEMVLHVIRRYCDSCSENPTYKPSRGR
jgi:hypothetical protein